MIYKQGSEYKDSTQAEETVEEKPEGRGRKIPLGAAVAGIVGLVLLVLGIIVFYPKDKGPSTQDASSTLPTVIEGDDAYWEQYDTFAYTAEEKEQLRAWGYTGEEIEEGEAEEVPADDLISKSKKAQEEARATLSNPESPEYKALLNNTWVGQQSITLPQYVEGETEGAVHYDTHTYNADYDKVPAHGCSLFLKVHLEDGTYTFMECPLVRYMQLSDSGNIVVQYSTATINGIKIVYDMVEVAVQ